MKNVPGTDFAVPFNILQFLLWCRLMDKMTYERTFIRIFNISNLSYCMTFTSQISFPLYQIQTTLVKITLRHTFCGKNNTKFCMYGDVANKAAIYWILAFFSFISQLFMTFVTTRIILALCTIIVYSWTDFQTLIYAACINKLSAINIISFALDHR